jgi:hypothetical protein
MPANQPSIATALAVKKQTVKNRCLHVAVLIFDASMGILSIVLLPRLNLPAVSFTLPLSYEPAMNLAC